MKKITTLFCTIMGILMLPSGTVMADELTYKEDIDKNRIFDILDLSSVATKYNLKSGNSNYNLSHDVNSDGIIDIYDLVMVSKRIGNTETNMTDFELKDNTKLDSYKETFKIPNNNIIEITSLGGNYGSNTIDKAIDGNKNTFFETGKANSTTFQNEVTIKFNSVVEINKVVYASRQDASLKGFMKKYEVYGSLTESENDFTLIFSGSGVDRAAFQEIRFQPTKFKRLKLKFVEAKDYWASISEIEFYKEDTLLDEVKNIFIDGTCSSLTNEFNTIEKLNLFESKLNVHPFKDDYKALIDVAKDIVSNPDKYKNAPIITASQRGDENKEASLRKIQSAFHSLDSFGYYVAPGETFSVFVDADPNGPMPTLLLGQAGKDKNDWRRWYSLKPGMNTFTAQGFDQMMPAAVYIVNRALPHEQKYAPRVRLDGGTKYPMYVHGKTTPEEFRAELEAYAPNVSININDFANGKPTDGKVYNIAELVSENNTITISALGALQGVKELDGTGFTVSDTMDDYEELYQMFQSYSGFVEGDPNPIHTPLPSKFTYRVFSNGPYGWADHGYTGYNGGDETRREGGFYKSFTKPLGNSWGEYHEVGHKMNNSTTVHGEVTNNLYSQRFCLEFGTGYNRVDYDYLYGRVSGKPVELGFFTNLGFLSQVEYYYGKDTIAKTYRVARENPNDLFTGVTDSRQRLILAMSVAVGYDLLDHFAFYNYVEITDVMRAKVANLPKPTVKLHYVNDSLFNYTGNGFVDVVKPSIESIRQNVNGEKTNNILTFSIDKANEEHLLGFEVYRDGVLVGFTKNNTYTDENVTATTNYNYSIKAVDKKLNIKGAFSLNSLAPIIVADEKITIEKGTTFNAIEFAKGYSYDNKDLTSAITVKTSNVDTNKLGIYNVTYKLVDSTNNLLAEKTISVEVVSESVYLSDFDWESATTGYNTVRKDKANGGGALTVFNGYNIDTVNKGFGTHAISEIIYDLTDKKYERFESYVGVDGTSTSASSSITFEVYVDGIKKYDSGVMKITNSKKFVSVNVKDAKEIKLKVTDAGNGISADGAVWGDTKLITNNAFPIINIDRYKTFKIGDEINLVDGLEATDAEDGILTNKISVSGTVNNQVVGDYKVIYTVKDNNNNVTTKEVTYSVVNMENFIYLSDLDWKSASCGYGTIKKDLSPSGGTIRLTNANNQEERFEKGLGTHATTTITYDLTKGNYKYFTAKVGIDRAMFGSVGSVTFEVYVDSVKAYDSGLINSRNPYKVLEVDINGAKELKIVATDGGNGNGSDHATWADTKLH